MTDSLLSSVMMAQAQGRVVRHALEDPLSANRAPSQYRPVFEFSAADGRRVEILSPVCYQFGCGKYPIGRIVTVSYEPSDPSRARVEGQDAAANKAIFLLAFFAVFALIGMSILVLR